MLLLIAPIFHSFAMSLPPKACNIKAMTKAIPATCPGTNPESLADDIAVLHVKPPTPTADLSGSQNLNPGCLFGSDEVKRKGDLVLQTGHVIEVVTKLFLVVQNATGKPPDVCISTE